MNKIAKDKKVNLFVYGNLQYAHSKYDAFTFGELRHRFSEDVAAKFGKKYKTRVYGQIHKIKESKLKVLDKSEQPEYKRKLIELNDGISAFAYEYIKDDWKNHEPIISGKYKQSVLKKTKGDNKMSLLQKLAELANELDANGYYVEAEQIDQILKQAVDMNLDMADAPMKPHQGIPPQMVPAPKLETKPNPPVTLPPKQEKPAPQMANDGKEHSPAIEKIIKMIEDLNEKDIKKTQNFLKDFIEELTEDKADYPMAKSMPPAQNPTSLPAPEIKTQKGAPDVGLGPRKDLGPK